jgi:hypothetical protein
MYTLLHLYLLPATYYVAPAGLQHLTARKNSSLSGIPCECCIKTVYIEDMDTRN